MSSFTIDELAPLVPLQSPVGPASVPSISLSSVETQQTSLYDQLAANLSQSSAALSQDLNITIPAATGMPNVWNTTSPVAGQDLPVIEPSSNAGINNTVPGSSSSNLLSWLSNMGNPVAQAGAVAASASDPTGGLAQTGSALTSAASSLKSIATWIGNISLAQVVTLVIGIIVIAAGLFSLRPVQNVVQGAVKTGKKAASLLA